MNQPTESEFLDDDGLKKPDRSLPAFGPRLISEITGEQIHLLYQRLIAKGLASISVAQYLQELKKINQIRSC
jgi:hypothetical protein